MNQNSLRTVRTIVTEVYGRTITIPADTECIPIQCGDAIRYAVKRNMAIPEYKADKTGGHAIDSMLVWDLDHHYVYIKDEDLR